AAGSQVPLPPQERCAARLGCDERHRSLAMTLRFAIPAMYRTGRTPIIVQRFFIVLAIAMAACATLPPGSDYPKTPSTAFAEPAATRVGKQLAKESVRHPGQSGFRILPHGVEGLLLRTQVVRAAERSIDIQYYI